jgi:CRP/FNR family cyclic AMP-dependent transcriptional regulator
MSVASTLSEIPLFSQLRESDIAGLARVTQERSYPKNSLILFADDPGDALYVVLSGQVKIIVGAEDGREVILSIRGEGEFFGEMSLIDEEPRSAHVIAMENSKLLVLRRDDFNRCLREMPAIATGLLRALCRRLRQADSMISSLVLLDVPGRVARLLLEMADRFDGVNIKQRLTHHMIAQMIGSSRETVSRTMRDFVSQGLIEIARKTFTIPNRRSLPRAAESTEMVTVQRRIVVIRKRPELEELTRSK